MNIVWVTSEAQPYAKTGGLADVSSSLPKALAEKGHKVSVIMPYYPQIMKDLTSRAKVVYNMMEVPFGWGSQWAQIREDKINENLSFYFIEFNMFYDRPNIYDYNGVEFGDNAARFIFLSRAAMQAVTTLGLNPDILHTNDWQSALCNVYLQSPLYSNESNFKGCRSVLTIHNIGYQGVFSKNNLFLTGLGWEYFNHTCLEYHDQLNFLKAGIMTASMVNAVSPTYASEILSAEYAFTLEEALQDINSRSRLKGILNGMDESTWNPETDSLIPANYSLNDLSGKAKCKEELQKEFGLEVTPDVPIYGIVSRLATQKGIDIFAEAIEEAISELDIQVVILGTGDPELENRLSGLNAGYPGKFSTYIGYDNKLAHLIEAGSDLFVMPSRYEPCGLNQMYSMKYGTIPLVRGTGGLEDTVINYDPSNISKSTGFKFYDLYPEALKNTIHWSHSVYKNNPENFKKMVYNGMRQDFSWNKTASEYEDMYEEAFK